MLCSVQFSSVAQSCLTLCNPMNCSRPGLPVLTNSRSLLKLKSIESVMPSNHLILCLPLFLLPPTPPSIRVISNKSTFHMRWPKYWSFSFSISPSKCYVTSCKYNVNATELVAGMCQIKALLFRTLWNFFSNILDPQLWNHGYGRPTVQMRTLRQKELNCI